MPRVKRGMGHVKRRRNLLKDAKGYRHGRKKLVKRAKIAVLKAGKYAYRDRKAKKRVTRRLWQVKLNAALRPLELTYSKFIDLLKKSKIELDRKVLADMAEHNPEIFAKLIAKIKSVK
ncbi:MAG: 50S ribosomal protein L20 [Parcubacteria group bacterium GW2011_GWC2_39_14]|nr:MAG: 50S ribosomal protein L20 [Parcubacteria group bacterium GW2011_GWC2_39_14]KKR54960.1 MAG: 50S ribosomal protein L20 [Parcubacteria group bacterium GW2011_GWA2_40_23]